MAGLDIPPGGESAWAYQAGFKNEKSHIMGVGAPSGIMGLKMDYRGSLHGNLGCGTWQPTPLALIGGVQTPKFAAPPQNAGP